jgi:hypothetical protein
MSIQDVTLRIRHYKPTAEVSHFVHFMSRDFYTKDDQEVLELVRRFMNEFTNDSNLGMAMQVWTDDSSEQNTMLEQYNAKGPGESKIFSLLLSSNDTHVKSQTDMIPLPKGLPDIPNASSRNYGLGEDSVQFVSVYHQLRGLVSQLSNKGTFQFRFTDDNRMIIVFLPHNARYSMAISLTIPAALV